MYVYLELAALAAHADAAVARLARVKLLGIWAKQGIKLKVKLSEVKAEPSTVTAAIGRKHPALAHIDMNQKTVFEETLTRLEGLIELASEHDITWPYYTFRSSSLKMKPSKGMSYEESKAEFQRIMIEVLRKYFPVCFE